LWERAPGEPPRTPQGLESQRSSCREMEPGERKCQWMRMPLLEGFGVSVDFCSRAGDGRMRHGVQVKAGWTMVEGVLGKGMGQVRGWGNGTYPPR